MVQETAQVDVAYDALTANDPAEALSRLESSRALDAKDPAALINAGTAYARLGRLKEARDSFRAAMDGRQHYHLELADGTWMDSREAARLAMSRLQYAER